jgi:hypothetical protein
MEYGPSNQAIKEPIIDTSLSRQKEKPPRSMALVTILVERALYLYKPL